MALGRLCDMLHKDDKDDANNVNGGNGKVCWITELGGTIDDQLTLPPIMIGGLGSGLVMVVEGSKSNDV